MKAKSSYNLPRYPHSQQDPPIGTHTQTRHRIFSLLFRITITTKPFSSNSLSHFLTKYDQTTLATSQLSVQYTDDLFYSNVQVRTAFYCYSPCDLKFILNYKSKQWWAESTRTNRQVGGSHAVQHLTAEPCLSVMLFFSLF